MNKWPAQIACPQCVVCRFSERPDCHLCKGRGFIDVILNDSHLGVNESRRESKRVQNFLKHKRENDEPSFANHAGTRD